MIACAGGVVCAVWFGDATDGQRGGAVGVALSFFCLFVGPSVAADALYGPTPEALELPEPGKGTSDVQQVNKTRKPHITNVQNAVTAMLDRSSLENRYLAASSVISTLTWGFGDWVASALGAPPA